MVKCRKCGKRPIGNFPPEDYFHEHHVIPKSSLKNFEEIEYKEGKIILCEHHHKILHSQLRNLKIKSKKGIKTFTNLWLKE